MGGGVCGGEWSEGSEAKFGRRMVKGAVWEVREVGKGASSEAGSSKQREGGRRGSGRQAEGREGRRRLTRTWRT